MNAQQFLYTMAATANALDPEQHMNLASQDVSVFGVPGFDVTGYEGWFSRRKHELKSVETVEGVDGTVNTHGLESVNLKDDDGNCRVSKERVLPQDEPESGIRRGAL